MLILRAIWGTLYDMTPHYLGNLCTMTKTVLWDAPQRFYLDIELEYLRLKRLSEPEPEPEPEQKRLINAFLSRFWRIYK
jgi:hypothetical protein